MAEQIINIGTLANDGTGDTLREASRKSRDNDTELYATKVDKVLNKSLVLDTEIAKIHAALTISATPNGLSLTGQELALQLASTTQTGALSNTDWNTFNGKAPASGSANYIQASPASEQVGSIWINSTIQATTAKLTNLTDGYLPYHISDASGLGNSSISQSATGNINILGGSGADVLFLSKTTGSSIGLSGATGYTQKVILSATNSTNPDFDIYTGGSKRVTVLSGGNILIGTTTDDTVNKLQVNGSGKFASSVQVGDNTAVASESNVGAMRYRVSGNNSYVDVCMQTGAATYAWINTMQNTW